MAGGDGADLAGVFARIHEAVTPVVEAERAGKAHVLAELQAGRRAGDQIGAGATDQRVVSAPAIDCVVPTAHIGEVVAVAAGEVGVAHASDDIIVSIRATDVVISSRAAGQDFLLQPGAKNSPVS